MSDAKPRLSEIIINNLMIALILAGFGLWANSRLERQKAQFQSELETQRSLTQRELESIRVALAQQGVLASRRIAAYERVWTAASSFLRIDEDLGESRVSREQLAELTTAHRQFETAVWDNFPFLDDSTRSDVGKLVQGLRPSLRADGRQIPVSIDILQLRADLAHNLYRRMQLAASVSVPAPAH